MSSRSLLLSLALALVIVCPPALAQSDTALPGRLPPGATLRGTYVIAGTGTAPIETELDFSLALTRAPSVVVVPGPYCLASNMCPGMPPPPSCPGSVDNPQAAPGILCIYEGSTRQNLSGPPQLVDPVTGTSGTASAIGAVLSASSADPTKPAYDSGTWAVSAPLPAAELHLVAPGRARPGQTIRIAVRTSDPSLQRSVGYGIENLLQRRDGARWRSIYHLPFGGRLLQAPPAPVPISNRRYVVPALGISGSRLLPIRLPNVRPGQYRLAKQVMIGTDSRWIYAVVRIRA